VVALPEGQGDAGVAFAGGGQAPSSKEGDANKKGFNV
jgi:hypothetical protein